MATMRLDLQDGIHILTLTNGDGENTFTLDVLNEYLAAFDVIDQFQGNTALLIRCEHEKTFSTGINLAWLRDQPAEQRPIFLKTMSTVLYRLALLSAPTVVCLNGNAYAGGAILAAAADFRLMRADRGRFCLPEVNINMTFPPVMLDTVRLLPNEHALKLMMLTGRAYTGVECQASNLVDAIYPQEELQARGFELAQSLGQKDRATYTEIRNSLRADMARHGSDLGLN